ncbi:MAG: YhcH/YjgK/YiaL family protein, partial [Alistipes sp.]
MILDSLKNSALYYAVNPRLKQAFDYLTATDLTKLEVGKHVIDGDNIFANVMERELKKPTDAKLEIHNTYLDIQVLITGEQESFGWSERAEVKISQAEFDEQKDIQLFDDVPQTYYTRKKGQFT